MRLFCAIAIGLFVAVHPVMAQSAAPAITEIESAYLRGEYALVIQQAQRVLQDLASPRDADYLWYLMGMSHLQLRQLPEAQQSLQLVVEQFAESRWRPDAEVGLADAVWIAGSPPEAIVLYQAIIRRWGAEHSIAVRTYYQLGQAARAAGEWQIAREALQTIVTQYPASFEAGLAQRILAEAEFAFSVQVGAFGVQENALRLQQQLVRRGYAATVDRTLADGRAMHRVRVGRYTSREEASQAAQQLRQDGFPGKIVP